MNSDFAMQGPDDGYVCFDCYSKVWQLGSADQSGAPSSKRQKPCRPTSSTSPRVSAASCRLRIHGRCAKKDIINTVVYAIRQGKYSIAFRQLLSTGPAARRAFIATVKQSVAQDCDVTQAPSTTQSSAERSRSHRFAGAMHWTTFVAQRRRCTPLSSRQCQRILLKLTASCSKPSALLKKIMTF